MHFLGALAISFVHLLSMRVRYRASDIFLFLEECGALARAIVTLISFLVGIILTVVFFPCGKTPLRTS